LQSSSTTRPARYLVGAVASVIGAFFFVMGVEPVSAATFNTAHHNVAKDEIGGLESIINTNLPLTISVNQICVGFDYDQLVATLVYWDYGIQPLTTQPDSPSCNDNSFRLLVATRGVVTQTNQTNGNLAGYYPSTIQPFWNSNPWNRKGWSCLRAAYATREWYICSTHLTGDADYDHRAKQQSDYMRQTVIGGFESGVIRIVSGDLNLVPAPNMGRQYNAGLWYNQYREADQLRYNSGNHHFTSSVCPAICKIDYTFVSSALSDDVANPPEPNRCGSGSTIPSSSWPSDHCLLYGSFQWK